MRTQSLFAVLFLNLLMIGCRGVPAGTALSSSNEIAVEALRAVVLVETYSDVSGAQPRSIVLTPAGQQEEGAINKLSEEGLSLTSYRGEPPSAATGVPKLSILVATSKTPGHAACGVSISWGNLARREFIVSLKHTTTSGWRVIKVRLASES